MTDIHGLGRNFPLYGPQGIRPAEISSQPSSTGRADLPAQAGRPTAKEVVIKNLEIFKSSSLPYLAQAKIDEMPERTPAELSKEEAQTCKDARKAAQMGYVAEIGIQRFK